MPFARIHSDDAGLRRRKTTYASVLAAWPFLEAILGIEYDIMSDTVKAREFGFADVVDTTKMFPRLFAQFRRDRVIP